MKKRISYIDIAKCFAIIFIVFCHALGESSNCRPIFKFLFSFHVILFFILSGYTFKLKEESAFSFIKNKFLRIMVPYLVWALLFLIPYMVLGERLNETIGTNASFDLKIQIKNAFYGIAKNGALKQNTSLWFLPALFSTEIIYYFIIKLTKKTSFRAKLVLLIPLTIISYLSAYNLKIILPWGINSALVIGIFFYFGYLCKEYNLFSKEKIFKLPFILIFIIIGCLANHYNSKISYLGYQYGNLTLAILSGLTLSIATIYLAFLINKSNLLEYIGRNTLGILIFHKIIILIFRTMLGPITRLLKNSTMLIELSLAVLILVISITCSLICTEIIRKIFPILIGEKRAPKLEKNI